MNLQELERAEQLIKLSEFLDKPLKEGFACSPDGPELYQLVRALIEDGQFTALLHLKRAEYAAQLALDSLTQDTAYLRDDLEEHLRRLQSLLTKIEQEEHLRRDREVLLSLSSDDPEQGLSSWTSGRTTDSTSSEQ